MTTKRKRTPRCDICGLRDDKVWMHQMIEHAAELEARRIRARNVRSKARRQAEARRAG